MMKKDDTMTSKTQTLTDRQKDILERCSNIFETAKGILNGRVEKILNFGYDNKHYRVAMVCILLAGIALAMFLLNHYMVLSIDDYVYSFKFTSDAFDGNTLARLERISSLKDVLESQYRHYFIWGGRSVAHTLAQFFLMYDKWIFNIANSIAYVLLLLVIYFHVLGRISWKPGLIILINVCLFAFTPATGRDFIWLTGSCNYLWGPLLSFAYLLVFRFQINKDEPIINNILLEIVYGLLGIICTWTNENMAVTMVVLALTFNGYVYLHRGNCYRWSILANIGIFVGAAILISAPGNRVRWAYSLELGYVADISYIKNFINITKMFLDVGFLCVPVGVSLLCHILNKRAKSDNVLWFYVLGLFVSMYSMVGSPAYTDSPKVISLIFAIIMLGRYWNNIPMSLLCNRKAWVIVMILMLMLDFKMYKIAIKDILAYEEINTVNMETVSEAKKSGNMDPILMKYVWTSKFGSELAGEESLTTSPRGWRNNSFANYYGLNTVRVGCEDLEDVGKASKIKVKRRLFKDAIQYLSDLRTELKVSGTNKKE